MLCYALVVRQCGEALFNSPVEGDGTREEEGHEVDLERSYSSELHLKWLSPPTTVLLIKKINDEEATKRFKEFTSWIVQVTPPPDPSPSS